MLMVILASWSCPLQITICWGLLHHFYIPIIYHQYPNLFHFRLAKSPNRAWAEGVLQDKVRNASIGKRRRGEIDLNGSSSNSREKSWNITRQKNGRFNLIDQLVGGWATPLKNMKVNWDDDIPNIWENKIDVPNHQPVRNKIRIESIKKWTVFRENMAAKPFCLHSMCSLCFPATNSGTTVPFQPKPSWNSCLSVKDGAYSGHQKKTWIVIYVPANVKVWAQNQTKIVALYISWGTSQAKISGSSSPKKQIAWQTANEFSRWKI